MNKMLVAAALITAGIIALSVYKSDQKDSVSGAVVHDSSEKKNNPPREVAPPEGSLQEPEDDRSGPMTPVTKSPTINAVAQSDTAIAEPTHLAEKDWIEAKRGMKAEYALSPNWELDIDYLLYGLSTLQHERLKSVLNLKDPASIDWKAVIKTEEGEALSEQQIEDLSIFAEDYSKTLTPMRKDVRDLLERSLLEYWEHDLGQRYRVSVADVDQLPPHQEPTGIFNSEFVARHGDWAVYVNFDSATFPVLEDLLIETKRLKERFYFDLESVAAR